MGLQSAISKLTGIAPSIPEVNDRKWAKCERSQRVFTNADNSACIILDKNNQICGGTFYATHKGRPCLIEDNTILCPVTIIVETENGFVPEFSHYEILLEQ